MAVDLTQYDRDPRQLGAAPAGYPGIDPERARLLQAMFGPGASDPVPAPPPAPEQPPPAIGQNADAAPRVPANPPAPEAYSAPQGAPNSTWHDIQGFLAGFGGGPAGVQTFNARDAAANAQAKEARMRDPNSPESAQARQAAMPILAKLGFSDADISRLSVADINSAGGIGSLVKQVSEQRAAAEKARASEEAFYRHAQFTGNTSPEKEKIAEIAAGNSLANAKATAEYTHALTNRGNAPVDLAAEGARLAEMFKTAEGGTPAGLQSRLAAIGNLPEDKRQEALISFWKDAEAEKNRPRTFGDPLRAEDIEGTGWQLNKGADPAAVERIINKRALTKETLAKLHNSATALQSLDKMIENRRRYGSQGMESNQEIAQDNRLQRETVIQNYAEGMGMPGTNETQKKLEALFPDANAPLGSGAGGVVQGIGHQLGLTGDPVLERLLAARAEAEKNLTTKHGLPMHYDPRSIGKVAPATPAAATPNIGVAPTAKGGGVKVPAGTRVRKAGDTSGRTGVVDEDTTTQELLDHGLEVVQ